MANQQTNVDLYEHQDETIVVFRYLGDRRHDYPRSEGAQFANDCRLPVWTATLPMLEVGKSYIQHRKFAQARSAGKTSYTIVRTVALPENMGNGLFLSDQLWRQSQTRANDKHIQPRNDPMFHLMLAKYFNVPLPLNFADLPGHDWKTWGYTYLEITGEKKTGMTEPEYKDWFQTLG